jgi:hypothetical protein
LRCETLVFGHKSKLQVDLGDLQSEKEHLAAFLQTNLNAPITQVEHKLVIESEKLSVIELEREVDKYVHRHNLSRTHWVSAENNTVKVNRFKGSDKKKEKHNKNAPHQSATQSWGL